MVASLQKYAGHLCWGKQDTSYRGMQVTSEEVCRISQARRAHNSWWNKGVFCKKIQSDACYMGTKKARQKHCLAFIMVGFKNQICNPSPPSPVLSPLLPPVPLPAPLPAPVQLLLPELPVPVLVFVSASSSSEESLYPLSKVMFFKVAFRSLPG